MSHDADQCNNDATLSPKNFDAAIAVPPRSERIIWGAKAIAGVLGVSAEYVRTTLAALDGSPVQRRGKRFCAHADDLRAFFRTKP